MAARTTERLNGAAGLARAAEILRNGGTAAFPTETVYGLGANALDPKAVEKIFVAKDRPSWDPLIVHVSDRAMLNSVAHVTPRAEALIAAFWPGPLTLLLPRTSSVPEAVTAGRPLVGVRMPAHPLAAALIREAGVPIAAPSANRFGHTSPTTARHVLDDLEGRIDAVLDGGPTSVGVESTVLDPNLMLIYRPGAITPEQLQPVAGPANLYHPPATPTTPQSLPSPGVGIRHYAPHARVLLVNTLVELQQSADDLLQSGESLGIMLPEGWLAPSSAVIFPWGDWHSPSTLAKNLFAGLRQLDEAGVSNILCPLPPAHGIGLAIRDRLHKAARAK